MKVIISLKINVFIPKYVISRKIAIIRGEMMRDRQEIKNMIENATDFPNLPEIAEEVLVLTGDPDVSLLSISLLIEKDPSLSLRILKLVNSPFFGLSRTISNIKEAVPRLGANEIRNIVMADSLFTVFPAEFVPLYKTCF